MVPEEEVEDDHSPKEAEESKMHNVFSVPHASSEYVAANI